ncbi:MAG: diguanylate cyclase domain-containing protein [Spirochaetota bacterium]
MRARILLFFQVTFATVIVGLVLPMSMEFPSPQREQMFVLTGANLAFVIGLFLLMRSGRIMLVCWLQVLAMWVTPLIHMLVEGGLYSTAFIGWLMDIVLAGLLIGRVGGTILAGLSVAASLVLTIMWQHGLIAPPVVQPPLKMFALSAVMLLVLAALQWFGSKQSEQLEKRSKGLQARLDLLAEDYIGEWKWQLETGIIEWSKNMPAIVGRPNQRLEGNLRQLQAMVFPDDWKPFEQALKNAQKSPSKSYYVEHRVVDANGGIYWVENRGRVFFNENNVAVTVGGIITRIDERKYIESALDRRGKRLRLVFENSPVFILVLDVDGLILSINHVEEGYSREQIIGKARILDYLPSQSHALARDAMHRALASKEPVVYDLQGYGANGKIEWYANRLVQFREDGKVRLLLMASNITARKEAEERLERLATRDSLTGLANRHRILEMVDRLTSGDNRFFLLFIDLDHFKTINDTLGHTVGDQLLVHIAQEIQQMLGAQDHLARLGGDEFLALLVAEDLETDPAFRLRAEHTAARIITETALPHTIGTSELFVSASIGLSHFPRDAGTTGELIKFADLAMYEAKQRGRAGYAFFE